MTGEDLSITVTWPVVLLYGLATALATGLGALPFLWLRSISRRTEAITGAIASGLMLGASFQLIAEGTSFNATATIVGGLLGLVFILLGKRLLGDREVDVAGLRGASTGRVLLVLAVMTLHSFSEGIAVGVSFGGGAALAGLITLAIAVHNVPEGLAISAVLRPRGASVLACAGWSVFSSLPQPLMAVPAFLFVDRFQPVLPYGLGFAAGAMVLMVFLELLPEAYENASPRLVAAWTSFALGAMILFQQYL